MLIIKPISSYEIQDDKLQGKVVLDILLKNMVRFEVYNGEDRKTLQDIMQSLGWRFLIEVSTHDFNYLSFGRPKNRRLGIPIKMKTTEELKKEKNANN